MSKKKLNGKIEPYDIVITDDINFSYDNFSKGTNRRIIPVTINKQKGEIVIIKAHSLGKTNEEILKRKEKVKKGYFLQVKDNNGREFYVENILIDKFSNGDTISNIYSSVDKLYPCNSSVENQDRSKIYNHVTKNKKQKNTSKNNIKMIRRLKSNKKKK